MLLVSSSSIAPYEYSVADLESTNVAIKRAANESQIARPLTMLFQSTPSLEGVVHGLVGLITNLFPVIGSEKSLLSIALADALAAYRLSGKNGEDQRFMHARFIVALIERASFIMDFEVRAVDGMGEGERWDVLRIPLHDWIQKHPSKRIVFTERAGVSDDDREVVKPMIAGKILSITDAKMLHLLRRKSSD